MTLSARFVFLCWMLAGGFVWTIVCGLGFATVTFVLQRWIREPWLETTLRGLLWFGIAFGLLLTARRAKRVPGCGRVRPAVVVLAALAGAAVGAYIGADVEVWVNASAERRNNIFLEDMGVTLMWAGYALGVSLGTLFLAQDVAREQECWRCWSVFLIRLQEPIAFGGAGAAITFEHACPYCGHLNEFRTPVSIEALDINTPSRRLVNLTRRLQMSGGSLLLKVRDVRRSVSAARTALEKSQRR